MPDRMAPAGSDLEPEVVFRSFLRMRSANMPQRTLQIASVCLPSRARLAVHGRRVLWLELCL